MANLKHSLRSYFKIAIRDIFRVRNGFYLVFCRNRDWNGVFLMFLTFFFEPFLVGKVMKENLLRIVRKSEKRKVKNIRNIFLIYILSSSYIISILSIISELWRKQFTQYLRKWSATALSARLPGQVNGTSTPEAARSPRTSA